MCSNVRLPEEYFPCNRMPNDTRTVYKAILHVYDLKVSQAKKKITITITMKITFFFQTFKQKNFEKKNFC